MNPDTLVAVSCYAGDVGQVTGNIEAYVHHQTPVVIFSPEDSPVDLPGWDCRHAGKRAYIGQDSLDRQRKYLEILLTYPHKYFLFNDSDSMCLSAEIPRYVYDSPDVVWSNEVVEPRPHASSLPKIAMQPPYFLSRALIQRMVGVADRIVIHPITPYIDHYMLQLVCEAGIFHKNFLEAGEPWTKVNRMGEPWGESWGEMSGRVRYHGRVFVHPVKSSDHLHRLLAHHRAYAQEHP